MAFELVEEVLDHAPAGLTATDVLVLAIIAEQARKATRAADIPSELLARRARLTASGLRKSFQRLEEHGVECRVPLRKLCDGRFLYAVPGRVCSFVLPVFDPPENCPCHRCQKAGLWSLLRTKEGPQGATTGLEGATAGPQGATAGPQSPPTSPERPKGLSPDRDGERVSASASADTPLAEDRRWSRSVEAEEAVQEVRANTPNRLRKHKQ